MSTQLGRAAKKFEAAFVGLPHAARQRMALAIYRAVPAMTQYQKDLEGIADDPAIVDATWDLIIAAGFRIALKGRDAFGARQIEDLRDNAPETYDFLLQLGRICSGFLPGGPVVPALPPVPPPDEAA